MKISAIRSDKVYSKIMNAPLDKKMTFIDMNL
jgi:hypothetical protein